MTWIKLCGFTLRPDVEAAIAAGADAVGFLASPAMTRSVSIDDLRTLIDGATVETFMVTVDADPEWLITTAASLGITGIQPHGRGSAAAIHLGLTEGLSVLAPIPIGRSVPDLGAIPPAALPLFDTADDDMHGGTGIAFDWSLVADVDRPFVLAGGLTPETVASAISLLRPWGVDVATGIETAPGIKDHAAMHRFVEEASR